ncbi:MAG: glycosyltransferase [Gemmatimonadetes bacterium]|nr:glycosyltransferase [Gemmatimonadota bacterium]
MTRVFALMDTRIVSGPGRQLAASVAPLRALGIEVEVVCFERADGPPSPFASFLDTLGIRRHVVHAPGRLDAALIARVEALLAAERPDVVQTHSYRPAFILWTLRRRGLRLPWIGFFHGQTHEDLKVRVYNLVDRLVLRRADRLVVVAPHQRARFPFTRRLRYIPNAALPGDAARANAVPPVIPDTLPRPWLGYIGRLSHEKGWDVLLDALARVPVSQPCSLVIAGDGPDRAACEARIDALGLRDRVHLLGQIPSALPLYAQLDAIVMPSRSEGMPNVVLEALGADVPIVAARVGAVPELIPDDATGLVVPPENVPALTDAIVRVLREGRTPQGSAARAASAARYTLAARVDALRALYGDVLTRAAA